MNLMFGKNLRFLRRGKGLNQAEIAEIVEKGDGTISNWEKGSAEPSFSEINEISKYFGISMSDFLFKDLESTYLIDNESSPKNKAKSAQKSVSKSVSNRVNEPFVDYGKTKSSDALIATLKELVDSKNEIIAELRGKNSDLKNELIECKKRNAQHKAAGHA